MTTSTWFQPLDLDTAPAASRPLVAASQKKFGFSPSPVAKAAGSPPLLQHLLAGFAAFDKTSLSHLEREVVAFAVSYDVGCHYCMALHSALGANAPDIAPHLEALRTGVPLGDPKLEALRVLASELVRERGRASPSAWDQFAAVGFTEQQGLDVMLGVGVYFLSTLTNIATRSELDPPFAAFAWTRD